MKYGYGHISTAPQDLFRKTYKKQVAHALHLLETNFHTRVEEITGISKNTLIRARREVTKGGK